MGRGLGHVTYFWNFGNSLIPLDRLKIQTSNFTRRLIVNDTKPEKWKVARRGRGPGHSPNISGTAEVINLKFDMLIEGKAY